MLTFPAIVSTPVAVFVPAPLNVMLLKVLAPIFAAPEPLKLIVEPVAVNVPVFVQLPPTL